MRILHVYKTYRPDTFGGVERTIYELCQNSAIHGFRADVLALSQQPTNGRLVELDDHRYASFKLNLSLRSTGFSVDYARAFRTFVQCYDVIHYHFPWPFMDLVHIAERIRNPYIITYHSDIVKQRVIAGLYEPLKKRFLHGARAIVATSPQYAKTSRVLSKFPALVIPLGLSEKNYPPAEFSGRVNDILQRTNPYFLTVGVNRHYKGFNSLLAAAPKISADIVIASAGPGARALRQRVEDEKLRNVSVLSDATEGEKIALLESCAAFVFPSDNRAEAYGLSLVEAAMKGRPMISCEIETGTSYVNINQETGLVIPPGNANELSNAMNWILNNPDISHRFGIAARRHYESNLTGDIMTNKYLDLYSGILVDVN